MNGVFDNTSNKKYDEIKPNYDVEDGVDTIKCEEGECDGCSYKDIKLNRCLFETCILSQFPFSIPYHAVFTNACKICGHPAPFTAMNSIGDNSAMVYIIPNSDYKKEELK